MNPPLFIAKFNYIPTKKARVSKKVCDILRVFLDVISLINRKRVRDASIYTSKKISLKNKNLSDIFLTCIY